MKIIAGSKNRVMVKYVPVNLREGASKLLLEGDVAADSSPQGTVMEVSEQDETGVKPVVKRGDVVAYFKHGAYPIELNTEKYFVMKEYDIYAIL